MADINVAAQLGVAATLVVLVGHAIAIGTWKGTHEERVRQQSDRLGKLETVHEAHASKLDDQHAETQGAIRRLVEQVGRLCGILEGRHEPAAE